MIKVLIVVTRAFREYDEYWRLKKDEDYKLYTCKDHGLLLLNTGELEEPIDDSVQPQIKVDFSTSTWYADLLAIMDDSDVQFLNEADETRIIGHGMVPNTENVPKLLHAPKEYSSRTNVLCEPDGENFSCGDISGTLPLDQLRYRFIHRDDELPNNEEQFLVHFNEVWQWIKPDEELPLNDYLNLLHSCLSYEKLNENGEPGWTDTIDPARAHFTNETQHEAWATFEKEPNIDNLRALRDELLGS